LLNLPNEEIAQELRGQGVKDVRRINIRRDGEFIPTKHFILTFNTPRLPEYIKARYVRCSVRFYIPNPLRCFKCQRFGHSKTNCRGTLTCGRCAATGHESTGRKANEKCVNCQGAHTSFSRSCPKWKLEKEVVATKYKNNVSFHEARRLVKEQTTPVGGSYASVVQKNHPVYQTTHCHHVVTMSTFPSTSKSPEPVPIASSSSADHNQVTPDTVTKFWKTSPFKAYSSVSVIAHGQRDKNKTENSNADTASLCSDSSRGNSSDSESDISVTSAPEVSNAQRNRARSQSEKSHKLKQAKRGLSQKGLPTKLKKSAHYNSVALGLADKGVVHKDLPSTFGGVPQVPDLKFHPSDEDKDLQMNCDVTLNSSKGAISVGELFNDTVEHILEELRPQSVKHVQRISIRRDGKLIPTKHLILTFSKPRLPQHVMVGYIRCPVRPYIPNPLRCYKCQRFGHSKPNCRGTLTCARCAVAGHESNDCTAKEKCINCKGDHPSFSRSCPSWKMEKEVVTLKFKNNISYPEARNLVKARISPAGTSYASVLKQPLVNNETQTIGTLICARLLTPKAT
ncbi:hypothetical protein AVEN_270891-1, partial [Araneus ventricosus]